ncbi:phosphoglucosamine mutase [Caldinitratiruptor microaerophilus]|uniref:Phosphoglucosamine mutase n=1 Tax=Caldinitratiruptor microaerophilus TaxID=671077 RepID=A0AA35CPK0_9FIRM|nr:phosphoglucosamine mutase [Caldinitratiruptor microaerophilus]BDG61662.1 phosphoglucosamine mutase [Caldinitratiruptor microaerophilus]
MGRLFGTDGVRGVANSPELPPELAFALGHAAARLAAQGRLGGQAGRRPVALIGRDTRRSGPMLAHALAAGVQSAGGDVLDLGVVTTPAVAYLTRALGADFGVVISASHNPAEYNGIKFFSRDGYKLPDAIEDELERLAGEPAGLRPTGAGVGEARDAHGEADRYVEYVAGTATADLSGLRIVVDCGHGAAYRLSPAVFRRLGAEVHVLGDAPDGLNINDRCGSTHPEALQEAVLRLGAHAGIAHDGDADRCIAVDERGQVVDGDQIMAICGLDLKARGLLAGDTVVATVMSNLGLELLLKRHGIRLERTRVGDRYVLERMLEIGAVLGGEQSGHVIFGHLGTTGDGILTGVQLLSAMVRAGRPLSEMAGQVERFPQILENVRVRERDGWQDRPRIVEAVQEAEARLKGRGRVLVRPSGTEPLIRVMLEGPDPVLLEELAARLREVIAAELG